METLYDCMEPKIIFFGDDYRASSLLQHFDVQGNFPQTVPNEANKLKNIISTNSKHLLVSNFFESPAFIEVLKRSTCCINAQITFGREYWDLKEEVNHFLDFGHSLHVWFDNPTDYQKIKEEFKEKWQQIIPVFWLTKKFDLMQILNNPTIANRQETLVFFAPPKKNALDSFLDLEEINLWVTKVKEICSLRPIFISEFFNNFSNDKIEFYHSFNYESFQKVLLKQKPAIYIIFQLLQIVKNFRMHAILDIIKNIFLFVSQPSRELLNSVGQNIIGLATGVGTNVYWGFVKYFGAVKTNLEIVKIRSYWRTYRAGGQFKILLISLFWIFWSVILNFTGECQSNIIKMYWYFYAKILKTKGLLKAFAIEVFWLPKRLFTVLHISTIKFYWWINTLPRRVYSQILLFIISSYWSVYAIVTKTIGFLKLLFTELRWLPQRIISFFTTLMVSSYWSIYSSIKKMIGILKIIAIEISWLPTRSRSFCKSGILIIYWLLYSAATKTVGTFKFLFVKIRWLPSIIFFRIQLLSIFVKWFLYKSASRIWGNCVAIYTHIYWNMIRVSHQFFSFVDLRLLFPFKKIFWYLQFHINYNHGYQAWLKNYLLYFCSQLFHKSKIIVLQLFYPVRKVYWFTSYQFKTRLYPVIYKYAKK